MTTKEWMREKLNEIAEKLPMQTHTEPASFACGYNMGYKQALLDLQRIYDELEND
jgi:hypothetical protein